MIRMGRMGSGFAGLGSGFTGFRLGFTGLEGLKDLKI